MNNYYIFNINDHFAKLYQLTPYDLFKLLSEIAKIDIKNYEFAYRLLEQIVLPIKDHELNNIELIGAKLRENTKNIYEINNVVVKFNKSSIVVTAEKIDFVNNIKLNSNNYFVCDFQNNNYFWL